MKKRLLVILLLGIISISFTGCLSMISPELNNPPVITSTPIETATVGEEYIYNVIATDPEGDNLTYSLLTDSPPDMDIDENSGVITWTPNSTGPFQVTVEVSDGKLSDVQSFSITVSEPSNRAPVITSTPVTSVILGETYSYTVEAADPDGDDLTYSLTDSPPDMDIDENSGVISWTSTAVGNFEVTVEVSDGELTDTQSFTITVNKALLISIEVLPPSMNLEIGESRTIDSVTAHYNNDTETIITPLSACTYESDKPGTATVSSSGIIKGIDSCTASTPVTITVSYTEDNITQIDTVSVIVTNPSPG